MLELGDFVMLSERFFHLLRNQGNEELDVVKCRERLINHDIISFIEVNDEEMEKYGQISGIPGTLSRTE